jgi:hypothetical protein
VSLSRVIGGEPTYLAPYERVPKRGIYIKGERLYDDGVFLGHIATDPPLVVCPVHCILEPQGETYVVHYKPVKAAVK